MEKQLTYEQWIDTYKPIINNPTAPYGGYMFETYGEELDVVIEAKKKDPFTIWTVFDNGDICQGYYLVNRLGYFICEVPIKDGDPDIVPELSYDFYVAENDENENQYDIILDGEVAITLPETIDDDAANNILELIIGFISESVVDKSNSKIEIKHSSENPPIGLIVDIFSEDDEFIDSITILYDDFEE
jgi:hypothetical protein